MNQPSRPCPTVGLSFTIILAAASSAWAEVPPIAISEWMYAGNGVNGGEFIEFTNVTDAPVDMTG